MTPWTVHGSSVHGILQARILEWVAISYSRGIFPTQGSNPDLVHWRQILYQKSYEGNPVILIGSVIFWNEISFYKKKNPIMKQNETLCYPLQKQKISMQNSTLGLLKISDSSSKSHSIFFGQNSGETSKWKAHCFISENYLIFSFFSLEIYIYIYIYIHTHTYTYI